MDIIRFSSKATGFSRGDKLEEDCNTWQFGLARIDILRVEECIQYRCKHSLARKLCVHGVTANQVTEAVVQNKKEGETCRNTLNAVANILEDQQRNKHSPHIQRVSLTARS